jgi:integrase
MIRFALGSGLRIGEICAVRWMDLDLDGIPVVSEHDMRLVPVVAVRQNVYPVKGKGLAVHGGKSAMALRIVPLPQLVVSCLRARHHLDDDLSWPVFASAGRDGTPTYRWPSNVRRNVRAMREHVSLDWMTPHRWRRTYATILDDEMTLTDCAKADLMGQAKFLKDTYVSRGELHPDAAVFLDAALR